MSSLSAPKQLLSTHDVLGGDQAPEIVARMAVEGVLGLAPHELAVNVARQVDVVGCTGQELAGLSADLGLGLDSGEAVDEIVQLVGGKVSDLVELDQKLDALLVVERPEGEVVPQFA